MSLKTTWLCTQQWSSTRRRYVIAGVVVVVVAVVVRQLITILPSSVMIRLRESFVWPFHRHPIYTHFLPHPCGQQWYGKLDNIMLELTNCGPEEESWCTEDPSNVDQNMYSVEIATSTVVTNGTTSLLPYTTTLTLAPTATTTPAPTTGKFLLRTSSSS